MKRVTVYIPATSANLGPGFDVLGVALHYFNEVSFAADPQMWTSHRFTPSLAMRIEGEGAQELPRTESNLVIRAAMKVFDKLKHWPRSLDVRLHNRIPLSRGMGSSAAATLGGLCAANALTGKKLSPQELVDMAVAMEGHPDNIVPAFYGGLCVAGTIDHITKHFRVKAPSSMKAVVCVPDRPLPTSEARRVLPGRVPLAAAIFTSSRVAFFLGAMLERRYDWLRFAMQDVLHQPARAPLVPGFKAVVRDAISAGAWGCALSGAGSSMIALTPPGRIAKHVGLAMQKAFAAHHVKSQVLELALENQGIRYR